VQSTTWRKTAVLDFVSHVLREQSILYASDKSSIRVAMTLDGTTILSKNKIDAMCSALKASSLWRDTHSKLTTEAIEWLEEKQAELDKECKEQGEMGSDPFSLDFHVCSTPNGRGQLALAVQQYNIKDMFTQSNTGQHMRSVVQFAMIAADHADPDLTMLHCWRADQGRRTAACRRMQGERLMNFFVQLMVTSIHHYF
jgi:hypothetical protein